MALEKPRIFISPELEESINRAVCFNLEVVQWGVEGGLRPGGMVQLYLMRHEKPREYWGSLNHIEGEMDDVNRTMLDELYRRIGAKAQDQPLVEGTVTVDGSIQAVTHRYDFSCVPADRRDSFYINEITVRQRLNGSREDAAPIVTTDVWLCSADWRAPFYWPDEQSQPD